LDNLERFKRGAEKNSHRPPSKGIVCERKDSPYKVTDKPSRHWIKVKKSHYSQLEGREELFEPTLKMR
jgi:ATP-dependent DNA ligase